MGSSGLKSKCIWVRELVENEKRILLLGPMLSDNGIYPVQAMIVLMLGSMFMLLIFGIKSLLPQYI